MVGQDQQAAPIQLVEAAQVVAQHAKEPHQADIKTKIPADDGTGTGDARLAPPHQHMQQGKDQHAQQQAAHAEGGKTDCRRKGTPGNRRAGTHGRQLMHGGSSATPGGWPHAQTWRRRPA
ncbi:hypothetical protein D3C81_1027540 [compost metagenome]